MDFKRKLKTIFRKFIIPGMNFLSWISHIKKATAEKHYSLNSEKWKGRQQQYVLEQEELVFLKYGQERRLWKRSIAKGMPLTAAFNSCEVIAAMNALVAVGAEADTRTFPSLLYHFERKGIILSGYFGTAPGSVKKYLKSRGLEVATLSLKEKYGYDNFPAYILVAQNGRSLFSEVHTMCIENSAKGYRLLSDFEGNRTYPKLSDVFAGYRGGNSSVLAVYGIKKKGR